MQHDAGDVLTEQLLEVLERRIIAVYSEAANDLERVIKEYFTQFAARDAEQAALVAAGELDEADYIQWRLNQIGRGKRFEALRDKVAERMTDANEYAVEYINAATPGIYAQGRNYSAYTVDKLTGGAYTLEHGEKLGIDFTLWDETTVRRLIVEQPNLMPFYPEERAVKRGIDIAYGRKQITAQITSSILCGDSVKHMADKLQKCIVDMNRASAIRTARTAATGAQNGGRQDGFRDAARLGIKVRKRWIAAKDARTRDAHGAADGQVVDYDKPFDVGGEKLMFPGDPSGSPRNLYNCRCTMRAVEKDGIEAEPRMMRVRDANGRNVVVPEMTYSEWKEWVNSKQGVEITDKDGIIPLKPSKKVDITVHNIGHIDIDKYRCITENISTDEVIITSERVAHIRERRGADFMEKYGSLFPQIVSDPDYIFSDERENTALVCKVIGDDDGTVNLVLRLAVTTDDSGRKNSILTAIRENQKRFNQRLRNNTPLYIKH